MWELELIIREEVILTTQVSYQARDKMAAKTVGRKHTLIFSLHEV